VSSGTGLPIDAIRAARAARLADLFARARAGEAVALDAVVRELNPLLWHVARGQGLGTEEAADVVQTTWLELLRRLQEIRSPQALTAWLVTTARRQAWHVRSQQRRRADHGTNAMEALPDPAPAAPELVEASERQRVLWQHFRQLSARCQKLLRIVAFVDRPDYDLIAQALEMPKGSIGPTRGRCLTKLREALLTDSRWERP
jgi:RNA polymerase sigma factor (sigma-70 family)